MPVSTEDGPEYAALKGTAANPARDPQKRPVTGPGSIGDVALRDGVLLIIAALGLAFLIAFSLRNYNV